VRSATDRGRRRVSLVTFFARAKKVTPLRSRRNIPRHHPGKTINPSRVPSPGTPRHLRDCGGGVTFFVHKESNQRNAPPSASRCALRIGSLCSSVNQGTVPNSLRSDIGTSSPLIPLRCSARFKADGKIKDKSAARVVRIYGACVDAFAFRPALKRAEHRRSGEGAEARVSERSEFPRRPSTD